MSPFAGCFYFDLRPPTLEDQRCALMVAPGRPTHVHSAPGLVMAQNAPGVSQPSPPAYATSARGGVCTFDGRLDGAASPGGELALDLFEKAGTGAFHALIGDWSLALWDAKDPAILLASDFAGVRPLYYHHSAASLKWSSSLEHLAAWTGSPDLDLEYVADMLTRCGTRGRTPYRGIRAVLPGTVIRARPGRFEVTRFWQPPVGRPLHYRREEEYAEHLRSLFEEAVRVRLAGAPAVCAELSGGLDSSSIVCMADRLVRSSGTAAPRLSTFSYRTPGTNDDAFIRAVEQSCAVQSVHLDGDLHPPLSVTCAGGSAPYWGAPRWIEVSRRMREAGATVLLTGQLGDLVMANWLDDAEQAADYLWQGKLVRALRESLAWSQSLQVTVYSILWRALRPNRALELRAGGKPYESFTPSFRKIARACARGMGWECPPGLLPSRRKRLRSLMDLLESRVLESPDTLAGASLAHPYAHRPLVEFMLAVPSAVACRPGEPRRLMRRALRGLVPDAVLRRRSKGSYEGLFLRAMRPCAAELLEDTRAMRLVELGCLDPVGIAARLRKLVEGLPCKEIQLRQVILLEVWLRQRRAAAPGLCARADDASAVPQKGYGIIP
jgi:asparagine synthase (glutamine-hydrolysing)